MKLIIALCLFIVFMTGCIPFMILGGVGSVGWSAYQDDRITELEKRVND